MILLQRGVVMSRLYPVVLLVLVVSVFSGCGGSNESLIPPVGGQVVTTPPTGRVIAFGEVANLARGTTMHLRLNRQGTEVREYEVAFLSTFTQGPDHLIVCQTPASLAVGAGDSGSPLMTSDDQLAGALAFGWDGDDHRFMARSIDDMLRLTPASPDRGITFKEQEIPLSYFLQGVSIPTLQRLATLDRTGVSDKFQIIPTNPGSNRLATSVPMPGQSISVNYITGPLVTGGAVGTITHQTGDDQWLIFGHQLGNFGERALPVSLASMDVMVETTFGSFKQAHPLNQPIGTLVEDRMYGCRVDPNRNPETFPVTVRVNYNDKTEKYIHQVAADKSSGVELYFILVGILAPLDQVFNKYGPGTAEGTLILRLQGAGTQTYEITVPEPAIDYGGDEGYYEENPSPPYVSDLSLGVAEVVMTKIFDLARYHPGVSFARVELNVTLHDFKPT